MRILILVGLFILLTLSSSYSNENKIDGAHCLIEEKVKITNCNKFKDDARGSRQKEACKHNKKKEIANIKHIYCFCQRIDGGVYNVNALDRIKRDYKIEHCKDNSLEITYGQYKNLNGYLPKGSYIIFEGERYKGRTFKIFAQSLGCNPQNRDVERCIQRWFPSFAGVGKISLEDVENIKEDKQLMGEIIFASRMLNQNQNQEPSEEEKQQALAQQNATGQATWKYTNGGVGYWDYGNGFGWAPPNPIRDNIIQGFSISQKAKNILMTGSNGKTIFVP